MTYAIVAGETLGQLEMFRGKAKEVGGQILIIEEVRKGNIDRRYLAVQKDDVLYRLSRNTGEWTKFMRKDVEVGGVQMAKWYFKDSDAKGLDFTFTSTTDLRYLWNDFLTGVAKRVPPGFGKLKPVKTEDQLPAPTETLKFGSKGDQVRWLQKKLKDMGVTDADGDMLIVDGDYRGKTKEAVMKLQASWGIDQTGVADQSTVLVLKKMLIGEPPPKRIAGSPERENVSTPVVSLDEYQKNLSKFAQEHTEVGTMPTFKKSGVMDCYDGMSQSIAQAQGTLAGFKEGKQVKLATLGYDKADPIIVKANKSYDFQAGDVIHWTVSPLTGNTAGHWGFIAAGEDGRLHIYHFKGGKKLEMADLDFGSDIKREIFKRGMNA
jgi:peptidoglycan hydrolase-like protein with peptidoglycan-binding domain